MNSGCPNPFSLDGPLVTVLITEPLSPASEGSVVGFMNNEQQELDLILWVSSNSEYSIIE